MQHPQVLTITAWPVTQETADHLGKYKDFKNTPMAIMAMNSINLKSSTLCYMGAFVLRQLAKEFGLERASEILFQTAQTMTMKSQFKTGPEEEKPYDPTDDFGDTEPDWDDEDDEGNDDDWDTRDPSTDLDLYDN